MNKLSPETPSDSDSESPSGWLSRMPWIACGVAALLIAIYVAVFRTLPLKERPEAWGQFGDYIGGLLNPLISLFTLTVAVSVWELQRKALNIQKQELAETRNAIKRQTFDQFFMSMLESHRSMIEQVTLIDAKSHMALQTGKRAIDSYFSQLCQLCQSAGDDSKVYGGPPRIITQEDFSYSGLEIFKFPDDVALHFFAAFCMRYYKTDLKNKDEDVIFPLSFGTLSFEQIFGHIFRSTYQILKIVDEQFENDSRIKRRYVDLLRAQMSESEFVFFALSALTKDGKKSWARSIQLDFFEDRLQNLPWTLKLAESFAVNKENLDQAKQLLEGE
jgi:Putative phage abortive infection protein